MYFQERGGALVATGRGGVVDRHGAGWRRGGCWPCGDAAGAPWRRTKATSIVYGMPRAAAELGAAEKILPLSAIADAIMQGIEKRKTKSV